MNTEFARALLRVIDPDGSEHAVPITHSPFCIGYAERNDLLLSDPAISRHHACLQLNGDQMLVVDMGSEHGTWVGATRLEVNEPRALDYHEIFRIGPYHLRLEPVTAAVLVHGSGEAAVTHQPSSASERSDVPIPSVPISAPVEQNPGPRLDVQLNTPEVSVEPGNRVNVSLLVTNQNPAADRFHLTLSGIPDQWWAAPPPLVELASGAHQTVNLTINPPRSPDSLAGQYRLTIDITSQHDPADTVQVYAVLTVTPYLAFSSALNSPRTGPNDLAYVVVHNAGNAPQLFTLTWLDPDNHYEFRPAERQLTLAAGETSEVEFQTVPRRPHWIGRSKTDVYAVKVAGHDGESQSHTGQIVSPALIPTWIVAVLLILAVIAAGSVAVSLAWTGPTAPVATATPVITAALLPTSTPLATNTPLPTGTPLPTTTPLPTNTPLPQSAPLPVVLLPTLLPPVVSAWRGEYFGNANLQGTPLIVRNDSDINFNWGRNPPDPSVPPDYFSVRWMRVFNFESRLYRFSSQADDGVRVYVDDNLIIDQWHPATPLMYTADVNLVAGPHTLRVEYYEGVIDAYILFKFEPLP